MANNRNDRHRHASERTKLFAAVLSIPSSLLLFYEVTTSFLNDVVVDPVTIAAALFGAVCPVVAFLFGQRIRKARFTTIERLEHRLIHEVRNSASRISVLAYQGRLTRPEFRGSLDSLLKDSATTIARLASAVSSKPCGAEIYLYDPSSLHHFRQLDEFSSDLFSRLEQREDDGLCTASDEVLKETAVHKSIKYYSDLKGTWPEFRHSSLVNPAEVIDSIVIVPIQTRLRALIREEDRDLFSDQPRYIAGFVKIHSEKRLDESTFELDTLAKWADLLFLGLQLFATSEIQQFGIEDSRIGRAIRGLTNEDNVHDLRASPNETPDESKGKGVDEETRHGEDKKGKKKPE